VRAQGIKVFLLLFRKTKEDSSFFAKKEAKKLLSPAASLFGSITANTRRIRKSRMSDGVALPPHDGGVFQPVPARLVASWPEGTFVENLAIGADGAVFVTVHPAGEVWRVSAAGERRLLVTLPTPVAGIAFGAGGDLFVSGGTPGQAGGVIWRVGPDGAFVRWVDLPAALFLNGLTLAPDGGLLVVDSLLGAIFHVSTVERKVSDWLRDDRLTPLPGVADLPGANGIKRFGDRYVVSNTSRAELYTIALDAAGQPGAVALLADRLRADDIAFDAAGALYCTTHIHYSVVRLAPDGGRVTIAGPDEGMVGATAAAFGPGGLYVTATGGVFAPLDGKVQPAKLVCLSL
jgi:sugar lactone lactonase YvrE